MYSFFKSARFGKGFLGPDISADVVNEFVEMCHHLRVLNSVRMEKVGIPITIRQYPMLSMVSIQHEGCKVLYFIIDQCLN